MVEVATLQEVELREVWPDEARDFTPWLAENPGLLAELLGLDLELVATEVSVGPFSADIVFRETAAEATVVVENLLEQTDHDHMGKLLTYAAGLEASYGVLVAKSFRPEHRSALNWLNSITQEGSGFFGVVVSAVRIADSPPAARLDLVVQPDSWSRQVQAAAKGQLSDTQRLYLDWWAQFLDEMAVRFPEWSHSRQPQTVSSMFFPSGTPGLRYQVGFAWPTGTETYQFRVGLYMDDGGEWFPRFRAHADEIEKPLGPDLARLLQWEEIPEARASRVALYLDPVDPKDHDSWQAYRNFALDGLAGLSEAFRPVIKPVAQ